MQRTCAYVSACGQLPTRTCCRAPRFAAIRQAVAARLLAGQTPLCHKANSTTYSRHQRSRNQTRRITTCSASSAAIGLGLFFSPSVIAVIYAYFKGKGNVKDGLSRMLTEFTQGYFQPNVGGESIPVAKGELSDLAGDEPLFKALYQW